MIPTIIVNCFCGIAEKSNSLWLLWFVEFTLTVLYASKVVSFTLIFASIQYSDESELLAKVSNPEEIYLREIMPAKLALNLKYINEQSLKTDLKIILKTVAKLLQG